MTPDVNTVAIFDLDGTLTRRDTYLAFLMLGLLRRPARWIRTPILSLAVIIHFLGIRDNTWLKRIFLRAILGDMSRAQMTAMADYFVERLLAQGLRARSKEIVEKHRLAGHHLLLATASFDFYAETISSVMGFDGVISTESDWSDDQILQGNLKSGNCYGTTKRERVESYLSHQNGEQYVIAYSDSHADLPLLEFADRAVSVNPTRKLRRIALHRNYDVEDWNRAGRPTKQILS